MDTLEQLQAELEKHRWIPVSEGLPKRIKTYDQSNFCIITDGKAWTVATRHFPYERWERYNAPHDLNLADITHWMPIILPPQVAEKG